MAFHKGLWYTCPDCGWRRWINAGCAVVCNQLHNKGATRK